MWDVRGMVRLLRIDFFGFGLFRVGSGVPI